MPVRSHPTRRTSPTVLTIPLIRTASKGVTESLLKPIRMPCMVICAINAGTAMALILV